MKRFFLIATLLSYSIGFAQVGIGNTDPKSILDISASSIGTPAHTDGILIPRIDEYPSPDPGADQDGMLVFVTGNGAPAKGFYYWDQGATNWVNVGASSDDADWYQVLTTDPATNITDEIYTLGKVSVGSNNSNPSSPFYVLGDPASDINTISTAVSGAYPAGTYSGISTSGALSDAGNYSALTNSLGGSNTGIVKGVVNSFLNTGTGQKIGLENSFSSADGVRKGVRNFFNTGSSISMGLENSAPGAYTIDGIIYGVTNDLSSAGNGQRYGVNTVINSTGSGTKYGERITINTAAGGLHYGIYSDVQKASGYAGYFLGRTSLGTATTDRYLMPSSDGTAGQVITTDGSGNLSFQAVPMDGTGTDDQIIDNFGVSGNTLGISLEDDGQSPRTVDLSNVDFNVSNFALAKMTMSVNQLLNAGSFTKLNFDTAGFDLGSNFNTTTDRFEATEAGYYRIMGSFTTTVTNGTFSVFDLYITVNGTALKSDYQVHPGSGYVSRFVEAVTYVPVGGYIEMWCYSQTAITINSFARYTTFEVERIR